MEKFHDYPTLAEHCNLLRKRSAEYQHLAQKLVAESSALISMASFSDAEKKLKDALAAVGMARLFSDRADETQP